MNYKTTKKAIMQGYDKVICVGYCDLQHLLYHERVIAHTERPEGWGADVYDYGNIAIVTGYAPFGNVRPGYEINKKYDDQAQAIVYNYNMKYEIQIEALSELIKQYIQEVTQ